MHRLEEAHEPEELAQETIIENLDPEEAARLSKVRNIGIAVSITGSVDNYCGDTLTISRHILTPARPLSQNESYTTPAA
jgi:hypothetical protein